MNIRNSDEHITFRLIQSSIFDWYNIEIIFATHPFFSHLWIITQWSNLDQYNLYIYYKFRSVLAISMCTCIGLIRILDDLHKSTFLPKSNQILQLFIQSIYLQIDIYFPLQLQINIYYISDHIEQSILHIMFKKLIFVDQRLSSFPTLFIDFKLEDRIRIIFWQ